MSMTLYDVLAKTTECLITQLFGSNVNIILKQGPKQKGIRDCGVYAIATCVSQAFCHQPSQFDQLKMRRHLVHCFEHKYFTTFPTV